MTPEERSVKDHAYYIANREKQLAQAKTRYRANPQATRQRSAARYFADPVAGRAYAHAYRLAHLDIRRTQDRKRKELAYAFMDAAKASGCVDCGTKEQVVLDFDHVRGKKLASVAKIVGTSLPKLFAEIDKCEVRCANCHRRITAKRRVA